MSNVTVDIETASGVNLKKHGIRRYANASEITLIAVSVDDAPARVVDYKTALELMQRATHLWAHNAEFERAFFPAKFKWRCTMTYAHALGLPAALKTLANKLKTVSKLPNVFGLKNFTGPDWAEKRLAFPSDWAEYERYCANDVDVTVACRRAMERVSPWVYDAHYARACAINDFGVPVDLAFVADARTSAAAFAARSQQLMCDATEGRITAATQVVRIRSAISGSCARSALELRRVYETDDKTLAIINARLAGADSCFSKFDAMHRTHVNGRCYATQQLFGASQTGRWAGRDVQPQNLARAREFATVAEAEEFARRVRAECKTGVCARDDLKAELRTAVRAKTGRVIVSADWNAIEPRMLAHLCEDEKTLNAYREADAGGPDPYRVTAAGIFNCAVSAVSK